MAPVAREPTADDAAGIGHVHVETWQASYRGDIPDAYLDAMSAEERGREWRHAIESDPGPRHGRFVTHADDEVSGFCMCGPAAHHGAAQDVGEVYAIYVHPDHWDSGAGRVLMVAALDFLRSAAFTSAVLWVLPTNDRAKRFYERGGWTLDGITKTEDVAGLEIPHTRYSIALL